MESLPKKKQIENWKKYKTKVLSVIIFLTSKVRPVLVKCARMSVLNLYKNAE